METGIHELTAGYALDALDADERERLRGAPPGLRDLPAGARIVLGDDRGAGRRGFRPGAEPRAARANPRGRSRGDAAERRAVRAATASPCARARRRGCDRGGRRARDRARGERMSRASSTTLARRSSGRRSQRPCSQTRTRSPLVSRQAKDVSSSAPTGGPSSSSTASIPLPRARPTRCGSSRVGASRQASPAGLFPGRDGTEIVALEGTVQAGDLVAVTVRAVRRRGRRRRRRARSSRSGLRLNRPFAGDSGFPRS